ncbi:hypothetical protein LTR47_007690 [Exophiala xenobiotica]|nr:hypothetical protein LTR92_010219 [Exophiala xenobiotica]KAK5230275.1 hypothetical protein LTR47_007690 [Exophiala xenobiotica]KAK5244778.1 hypothetical protein LTS06_009701 [Exophiala xenobiotica]KAK5321193.1 hypothetical protein LTR93_006436 [Exophiala xenobiotica]KAK5348448.1 hypothetical protein LTR61_007908 [Exophiala xenobiotica]
MATEYNICPGAMAHGVLPQVSKRCQCECSEMFFCSFQRSFQDFARDAGALRFSLSRFLHGCVHYLGRQYLHQDGGRSLCEQAFVYDPLETPDHFRIFELLPSQRADDQICIRLHHTCHGQPEYVYSAISYVWGDDTEALKIAGLCNGRLMKMTPNLHSALIRLRKTSTSRFLWADAICIDQGKSTPSLVEREQQVLLMNRTFSMAEEVIIDLGRTNDPQVLSVVDRFFSIPKDLWERACLISREESLAACFQFLEKYNLPDVSDPFWQAFVVFMQRSWFSRVWIIQEYALAKSSTFLIGDQTRPGTYLPDGLIRSLQYMVYLYNHDRRGKNQSNKNFASYVWDFDQPHTSVLLIQEAKLTQPAGIPLQTLIWRTRRFLAKDDRHKVYAILGLLNEAQVKNKIPVDYKSKGLEELGVEVAQYLIDTGRAPYVLYNCLGLRSKRVSWALLLTDPDEDAFSNLYRPEGHLENLVFDACDGKDFIHTWKRCSVSTTSTEPWWFALRRLLDWKPTASPTNETLRASLVVKGCMVDQIVNPTGPALPYPNEIKFADVEGRSSILPDIRDWVSSVQELQAEPIDQFALDCWRAVVADLIIPPQGEGNGYVRASRQSITPYCLEAIDNSARHACAVRNNSVDGFRPTMPLDEDFERYTKILSESFRYSFGRMLALTNKRRMICCVPRDTIAGDSVCIILGCPTPFVLRQVDEYHRVVGPCYVHGLMDGQALEADYWKEEDIEIR